MDLHLKRLKKWQIWIAHIRVILSRARLKVKQEVEKIYDYDESERIVR